jgi:hypothetical protein
MGQVATLLPFRDQVAQLLSLKSYIGEKCFLSCCQLRPRLLRPLNASPQGSSARNLHFFYPPRSAALPRRALACLSVYNSSQLLSRA